MRWWTPILVLTALGMAGCPDRDESSQGKNHQLTPGEIQPSQGLSLGGETVLITGLDFEKDGPVTEVLFGAIPATSYVVRSNTEIDAITPPHAEGTVDVRLWNARGSVAVLPNAFTFLSSGPCLMIQPDFGVSGDRVLIYSTGRCTWTPQSIPRFGGKPSWFITYIDPHTLECEVPAGPGPGPVDVEVVGGVDSAGTDCTCVMPDAFRYLRYRCMDPWPSHGPLAGGTSVWIVNLGPCYFTPATEVTFGGVPALNFIYVSSTEVSVEAPPRGGPGPRRCEGHRGRRAGPSLPLHRPGWVRLQSLRQRVRHLALRAFGGAEVGGNIRPDQGGRVRGQSRHLDPLRRCSGHHYPVPRPHLHAVHDTGLPGSRPRGRRNLLPVGEVLHPDGRILVQVDQSGRIRWVSKAGASR